MTFSIANLGVGIAAGSVVAGLYLFLLWRSLKRLTATPGAPRFLFDAAFRVAIVVALIMITSAGMWERLMGCLLGFAAVRLCAALLTSPPAKA